MASPWYLFKVRTCYWRAPITLSMLKPKVAEIARVLNAPKKIMMMCPNEDRRLSVFDAISGKTAELPSSPISEGEEEEDEICRRALKALI